MNNGYWRGILQHRLSRRRAVLAAGSTAAGAAFLAACGGGDSDQQSGGRRDTSGLITEAHDSSNEAKQGGTLKRQINADLPNLDVHVPLVNLSGLMPFTYSRLTKFKPGLLEPSAGEVIGDVMESWEFSPDKLQLTLKLRPNVKFHPVAPVNSRVVDIDDIVFSWNRVSNQGILRSEVNATNPNGPILSFQATDQRTAVLKLKEPIAYITSLLAVPNSGHFQVIPKEVEGGFDIRRMMIGTGPFYLSNYTPSVGFTFRKHPDYYDSPRPYLNQIDMPIIGEYAQNVAQFKAGALHFYGNAGEAVRAEDALSVKREAPHLLLYLDEISANPGQQTIFGYRPGGRSPFHDERVRQAFSMSVDRDAFIDLLYNVERFSSEGLPIETRWNTDLPNDSYKGWWLDPRDKDFGPNAKYFEHDIAEAKKLLAAAGYPSGGPEVISNHFTSNDYGPDFPSNLEVLEGMSREAGFTFTKNIIQYQQEFIPQYRDSRGNFDGISYRLGPAAPSPDPAARLLYNYYSGGDGFYGFDAVGKGDFSGDPFLDREILKARGELDDNRRKAIVHDLQRYLGKARYAMRWPGGANRLLLASPAVKNFNVFKGGGAPLTVSSYPHYWLDES
jgi:peptide/nickel transport system substrate-binding protein